MDIDITDLSPIKNVSFNLNAAQVKCNLCQKIVSLKEHSNHVKSCRQSNSKVESFRMIKCTICQKKVPQKDFLSHRRYKQFGCRDFKDYFFLKKYQQGPYYCCPTNKNPSST